MKCGVDSNVFATYNFEDQAWGVSGAVGYSASSVFLANLCVAKSSGGYFVRDGVTGGWTPVGNHKLAINKIVGEWTGKGPVTLADGSKQVLGRKEVTEFINDVCPILEDVISIPMGPPLVVYDGSKRLNIFVNKIREGIDENIHQTEELLRLIRQALCNQEGEKTLEEMIDEINDPNGSKEFRFVIHWLASIYQNPGINLQTNLWFVGQKKGIGKGTLMRVLKTVFGSAFGQASQQDWERGWNDFIEGKVIVEADEFKASSKVDFNLLIKKETTNTTVMINKRNTSSYPAPNVSNWIFTTNDEEPIIMEDDDRRNVIVQTTNDHRWTDRSIAFNNWLDDGANSLAVATGFAGLLRAVAVDVTLVKRAFETEIRRDMRDSSKNAAEVWIEQADENNLRGREYSPEDLYLRFFAPWAKMYFENTSIKSAKSLGRALTPLTKRGLLNKRRVGGSMVYCLPLRPGDELAEPGTDEVMRVIDRNMTDKVTDLGVIRASLLGDAQTQRMNRLVDIQRGLNDR